MNDQHWNTLVSVIRGGDDPSAPEGSRHRMPLAPELGWAHNAGLLHQIVSCGGDMPFGVPRENIETLISTV